MTPELIHCPLYPQHFMNLHGKHYTLVRKGMRNFAIIILAVYQRNDCYYFGYLRAIFSVRDCEWKWKGSNSDEEVGRMSTCETRGLFFFFVFSWVCRISSLTRHWTQASYKWKHGVLTTGPSWNSIFFFFPFSACCFEMTTKLIAANSLSINWVVCQVKKKDLQVTKFQ